MLNETLSVIFKHRGGGRVTYIFQIQLYKLETKVLCSNLLHCTFVTGCKVKKLVVEQSRQLCLKKGCHSNIEEGRRGPRLEKGFMSWESML